MAARDQEAILAKSTGGLAWDGTTIKAFKISIVSAFLSPHPQVAVDAFRRRFLMTDPSWLLAAGSGDGSQPLVSITSAKRVAGYLAAKSYRIETELTRNSKTKESLKNACFSLLDLTSIVQNPMKPTTLFSFLFLDLLLSSRPSLITTSTSERFMANFASAPKLP